MMQNNPSIKKEDFFSGNSFFTVKSVCPECFTESEALSKTESKETVNKICAECEKKQIEQRKIKANANYLWSTKVPPLFQSVPFSNNKKLIDSKASLIFGAIGVGKTFMAYSVTKSLLRDGLITDFTITTEAKILTDLKSGFKDNTVHEKISKYENIGFLVIDEIGKAKSTEFGSVQLFDIINTRYEWKRRTMLICNVNSSEELGSVFTGAIIDRFRDCTIEAKGESRRYK